MDKFNKLVIDVRAWLHGMASSDSRYYTALRALELGLTHHDGHRNGGEPEFIHQIRAAEYGRTLHHHMVDPCTVYTLVFLHDIVEDPNQRSKKAGRPVYVSPGDLMEKFGIAITEKVVALSKEVLGHKNPDYSLDRIFSDQDMSITKGLDRVDNVTSMVGVFKQERLVRYINETEQEFLPRIKRARREFPEQLQAYINMKHVIENRLFLAKYTLNNTAGGNTSVEN